MKVRKTRKIESEQEKRISKDQKIQKIRNLTISIYKLKESNYLHPMAEPEILVIEDVATNRRETCRLQS